MPHCTGYVEASLRHTVSLMHRLLSKPGQAMQIQLQSLPIFAAPSSQLTHEPLRHTVGIQALIWAMLSQAMPATVGLMMPAAALVGSLIWGDEKLLLATCLVPYLGTLLCQIWMEGHFTKRGEPTCSSERSP